MLACIGLCNRARLGVWTVTPEPVSDAFYDIL